MLPIGRQVKQFVYFMDLPQSVKKNEITPASPVNIIGKIIEPDKSVLDSAEGKEATFSLKS